MSEVMELRQSRSKLSLRRFAQYVGVPYWQLRDFEKRTTARDARERTRDELREAVKKVALEQPAYGYRFLYQEMLCSLSSADPNRVERHLLRQHTVDDPQDLSHTRHHSSFFVLSTYHQALKEKLDDGVEADGRKTRHVQQSP